MIFWALSSMCTPTIIDSNSASLIVPKSAAAKNSDPFLRWIANGYGVLCYTGTGKLGQEIRRTKRYRQKLYVYNSQYKASGMAKLISEGEMKIARNKLEVKQLQSNDEDLLALTLASNAEIIVTDDEDLKKDIKDYIRAVKRIDVAIYPRHQKRKTRQQFLDQRRCICRYTS